MLTIIPDLPQNVVGIKATGEVTSKELNAVVMPAVDALASSTDKINYLLYLDTDISKWTAGAWVKDAILGLRHLFKWHKVAVVTDQKGVEKFTDMFSYAVPGEYKGFSTGEYQQALQWVAS
jgi:predicted transcriptional regulator